MRAVRFALSDCAEVVIVGHAGMNDDYSMRFAAVRKSMVLADAHEAIN